MVLSILAERQVTQCYSCRIYESFGGGNSCFVLYWMESQTSYTPNSIFLLLISAESNACCYGLCDSYSPFTTHMSFD